MKAYALPPLLPVGIESTGHTWLHSRCWASWHRAREADAVAVLAARWIDQPKTDG